MTHAELHGFMGVKWVIVLFKNIFNFIQDYNFLFLGQQTLIRHLFNCKYMCKYISKCLWTGLRFNETYNFHEI